MSKIDKLTKFELYRKTKQAKQFYSSLVKQGQDTQHPKMQQLKSMIDYMEYRKQGTL
tara:strand:- start:1008 stop:1178 length:171 start_codon:yes stop_codon:yes gene_type:complete